MPDIAIETEQLRRTFGDFEAVAGVDLQVRRGEIYGFLGPNGAGKSTTVKVLCTLLSPSGGRASVAGFDVGRQPHEVRLRMGAALQDAAVDPKLTGRETLELQGRYYGLRKDEVARQMEHVLRLVDIGDAIDRALLIPSLGLLLSRVPFYVLLVAEVVLLSLIWLSTYIVIGMWLLVFLFLLF